MTSEEASSLKPGDKVYLVLSGSLQSGPTISEFRVDDLSSLKDGVLCVSRPHPYQMARIRERFSFEHLLLREAATAKLQSLKAGSGVKEDADSEYRAVMIATQNLYKNRDVLVEFNDRRSAARERNHAGRVFDVAVSASELHAVVTLLEKLRK